MFHLPVTYHQVVLWNDGKALIQHLSQFSRSAGSVAIPSFPPLGAMPAVSDPNILWSKPFQMVSLEMILIEISHHESAISSVLECRY